MSNETVINPKVKKLVLRDGKEYEVRPLSINELMKVWPIIKKLETAGENVDISLLEDLKTLAKIALGDKVTVDVGDLVDMLDVQVIIAALMGQTS